MDKFRHYFHSQTALKYRNFRLYLTGQTLSNIGTWIQRLAMIWLAYTLTNSPFLLGLVAFCEQFPIFICAPFAGVYVDKWDKQKALIIIEILAMVQGIVLGIVTFSGDVNIWILLALSLTLGTVNAFEVPLRQSFVVDMVNHDKNALLNAIALNSTTFNLSRLIGPSVAGILIATVGEAWCFLINGFSYFCVVVSLFLMKNIVQNRAAKTSQNVWQNMKEGLNFIKNKKMIYHLLLLLAAVSFCNASLRTLAPIFAKDVFGGSAHTLGYLMTAAGIGALCGALYLSGNSRIKVLFQLVSVNGIMLGIAMILFGISHYLLLSLLFLLVTGFSQMTHNTSTNTLLQLQVSDDKRGRVMSFYTVCVQGTMPFGSLLAGFIADHFSVTAAMIFMGIIAMAATVIFRFNLSKHYHH